MRSIAAEFNLPVSDSYSNFQRLAEENGVPENDARKANRRITGRWSYVPIFWNIRDFNWTRVTRERSRTPRNLIW